MVKKGFKVLTALSLLASVSIGSYSVAFAAAAPKDYTGYLIDGYCGSKGYDEFHKIDLKKSPEKHQTDCLKMSHCMNSGLGLSIKQSNGTYKYYKFDSKGAKLADNNIMMKTKRKFGNKVAVKGVISGSTITLASIKEAK